MKEFRPGKVICRTVTLRAGDRGLPNVTWVLTISESGVRFRRLHERKCEDKCLSWRQVIGHGLVFSAPTMEELLKLREARKCKV